MYLSILFPQEAGVSKEDAMEQIASGHGVVKKNTPLPALQQSEFQECPNIQNLSSTLLDRENEVCVVEPTQPPEKDPIEENIAFLTENNYVDEVLANVPKDGRLPDSILSTVSSSQNTHYQNIQVEWFVEFGWLELDEISWKLFCRYCKYYDPVGEFSAGMLLDDTLYENMLKHHKSESHRNSMFLHSEQFSDTLHHIQDLSYSQREENQTKDVANSMNEHGTVEKPIGIAPRHWSILFPWMQHDNASDCLFCKPCKEDGMSGSWVDGIKRSNVAVKDIEEHEQLVSHRTAVVQQKRHHLTALTLQSKLAHCVDVIDMRPKRDSLQSSNKKRKRGRPRKLTLRCV